jgi:type IV pilus assembly protein PilO
MQLGLNKLPWYGQMLLFAGIGLAGTLSYHYFYAGFPAGFLPDGGSTMRAEIATKQAQLVRERQDIAKGRAAESRLVEFKGELKDLESRFEALKAVVPEQRDVADMLRRIQTLATQASLVVKVFRPQAVATKTLHQEWPMGLELDGTYHNLARFFDQVSKVPRIINVGAIAIKAKGEDDTQDGTTITAQCTATTFVLLDQQTVQAAAAKKSAARPGAPAAARPPAAAR